MNVGMNDGYTEYNWNICTNVFINSNSDKVDQLW